MTNDELILLIRKCCGLITKPSEEELNVVKRKLIWLVQTQGAFSEDELKSILRESLKDVRFSLNEAVDLSDSIDIIKRIIDALRKEIKG